MKRLTKKLFSPPMLRLNTTVVFEVTFLLVASLAVLFYYSYETLKEECMKDADQTLESTTQHVDNVLRSIEQSSGNVYWDLLGHLDQPDRMMTYCRKLVECNTYIHGCAIAFKPGFYPDRELFMTYVHHRGIGQEYGQPTELVTANSFGSKPYTEQEWYTIPMTTGRGGWIGPLAEMEDEGKSLTFCLPLYNSQDTTEVNGKRQTVGVMAIDLSVELLSQIILAAKPSPNSYNVLLNGKGEYLIHPDKEMLSGHTVFDKTENGANPDLREIAEAMVAGQAGHKAFTLDGKRYYKFYKPFVRTNVPRRSMENLNWSIGLIYPEQDIFGIFQEMLRRVLIIAAVGLLLFFLLCRIIIRMQMKPLREITESAQRIAEGHYDDPMSDSTRNDEIGQFQKHFQTMQQLLSARVHEIRQLKKTLEEHGEKLNKTHRQMLRESMMKTTLFRKATDEMKAPAEVIVNSVDNLCDNYQTISLEVANSEVYTIKEQSETILTLLNQMSQATDEEDGKEESHE